MAKRRANGEGSIRKRKDGRWEGRIVVGHRANGLTIFRYLYADTQKELTAKLRQSIDIYAGANLTEESTMSLSKWLERWLDQTAASVRSRTLEGYRRDMENYVKPRLGQMPLARLTAEHLHKLYTFLLEEGRRNRSPGRGPGLAPSTIRGIHSTLHGALAAAVEERLLPANPADQVVLPKGEKPSLSILTSQQMERFLAAIRADDFWHDFFYIELTTGLRRGELCGLRWEDFNEATGELAIRRTVHANSTVGDNSLQRQLPVQETLTPALQEFSERLSAIEGHVPLWSMISAVQQFSTYIARYTAEYQLPAFSEERKSALIESYRQWGKCGWSWIGKTPLKFYSKPPIDIADANSRIKPYHNAEIVEELFLGLRSKAVRQGDLESAVFCYKSRQYKPCALVLFGMIDAKLIRKQSPSQNRLVGKRAIKKLHAQFDKTHDQQWLYTMLRYVNLFACLETMFEGGENFKSEPPVINRNYIDHGMEQRRVRKRDCIQLFFALDNLADFFDDNV